jgi:signal transduction histidine kinase
MAERLRRLHVELHHLHWQGRHGRPAALRLRLRWRHFCGVSLRRRLFIWFGATIFVTAMLNLGLARLALHSSLRGRIPAALFLVVPLVVLWAASGKIARRIARPLSGLVDVARDIGAGQVGARARLHWRGIDEIGELSRAINDMAERIERQIADQRELLAGVSHEIRTPLARLRLLVEIARDQGRAALDLDDFEREVIEIDGLVGELLASARLDFSALAVMPIDAGDLARSALARAGVLPEKLTVLRAEGSEAANLGLEGDPTLLGRALANLLRNAELHGAGVERLVVRADESTVAFAVLDRGPGFPPGEERRVFERFYRPQRSEVPPTTSAHPESAAGLGLGLALVRRIAEAHGGETMARNRPDGGAEVSLILPRRPDRPAATPGSSPFTDSRPRRS